MGSQELQARYESRAEDLKGLCDRLTLRVQDALLELPHIDRVTFRPKSVSSFITKASKRNDDGSPKYVDPLREIEDQVAGRVLVFFRSDLDVASDRLSSELGQIERVHKEPEGDAEFGYESEHFVCVIPNHLKPESWLDDPDAPATFELQLRTLFMHAWAEPQHDLGYKVGTQLTVTKDQRKKLAWVAASAWGADQVLNDLARDMASEHGE
jgi:ppGpp synthetase/RelA/SpoT-type nucleotidyltranferase